MPRLVVRGAEHVAQRGRPRTDSHDCAVGTVCRAGELAAFHWHCPPGAARLSHDLGDTVIDNASSSYYLEVELSSSCNSCSNILFYGCRITYEEPLL